MRIYMLKYSEVEWKDSGSSFKIKLGVGTGKTASAMNRVAGTVPETSRGLSSVVRWKLNIINSEQKKDKVIRKQRPSS